MTPTPSGLAEPHAARAASPGRWWMLMGIAALLLTLDQCIKWMVATNLPLGEIITVTVWFNLVHVLNPGAAFSFLADAGGWQRHALTAVGVAVSVMLAVLLWRGVRGRLEASAYIGLIGGALGNVVDRLRIGAVVDYLDLHWRDMHWPAFNLADIFVVGGAALLMLALFRSSGAAGETAQGHAT
ncbi:MAG: signal peptidase II [Piscinibacter sp.]|uniref:signal peptidase II n=1 Tax=Piscinibacter sp. TaxID=1903157 RepID=UPI0025870B09|nr:signal peptidase II [Piscinibacter sp.]MCW5662341.1 signal peptidase II [Piscinibacter sp.]